MAEPFVGEIRIFAGNFAPRGWAFTDGQILAITQNDALFSLFGTVYGGDGRTTFGLPDLRSRVPIHMGTGPGQSARALGSKGGAEKVTVQPNELPTHTHTVQFDTGAGTQNNPAGSYLAASPTVRVFRPAAPVAPLSAASVTNAGGNGSHNNIMPYLAINFIVALFGIYPSRN